MSSAISPVSSGPVPQAVDQAQPVVLSESPLDWFASAIGNKTKQASNWYTATWCNHPHLTPLATIPVATVAIPVAMESLFVFAGFLGGGPDGAVVVGVIGLGPTFLMTALTDVALFVAGIDGRSLTPDECPAG